MEQNNKLNCIFFGSDTFSLPALKCVAETTKLLFVITQNDSLAGRGKQIKKTPVREFCESKNISYFTTDSLSKDIDLQEKILLAKANVGVVVSFGQIIKKNIIDAFEHGIINIHPSLLPLYRGASPLQSALLAGDVESGITIMSIDEGMDHGPIYLQKKYPLDIFKNYLEASQYYSEKGAELLSETLENISNHKVNLIEQNHSSATICKKISKIQGIFDSSTDRVIDLFNKIRAFTPWPGVTLLDKSTSFRLLSIDKNHILSLQSGKLPFILHEKMLFIRCSDAYVRVLELQPENKKPLSDKEFINGYSKYILAENS